MAYQANLGGADRRYLLRTPEERRRAFRSAVRHSRLVGTLRWLLPVLAMVVLGAYFFSTTRMSVTVGDFTASIDGMEVADGNLRMLNPTLKGADKKNGKYLVRAEYADQDIKNPNIIKLHAIKADVDDPDGGWSKMQAVRGVFDSKAERLIMKDRITVATSSGVTGVLKYATLEMATQTLRSHNPVSFELNGGTVRADAMTLRSKENTIVFRGRVAVHIEPGKAKAGAGQAQRGSAQPQPVQQPAPAQQLAPAIQPQGATQQVPRR